MMNSGGRKQINSKERTESRRGRGWSNDLKKKRRMKLQNVIDGKGKGVDTLTEA